MTEEIDNNEEATFCKPTDIKRVSKDAVNKLLSAQVQEFSLKILTSLIDYILIHHNPGDFKYWNCCKRANRK
jgi:hypothetical protein